MFDDSTDFLDIFGDRRGFRRSILIVRKFLKCYFIGIHRIISRINFGGLELIVCDFNTIFYEMDFLTERVSGTHQGIWTKSHFEYNVNIPGVCAVYQIPKSHKNKL